MTETAESRLAVVTGTTSGIGAALAERCLGRLEANEERCTENLEKSLALATGLVPRLGYDRAADLAKEAHRSGRTIREVAIEQKVLPADEINRIIDEMIGKSDNRR